MEVLPHKLNVLEQCQIYPPSNSVSPTSISLTVFDLAQLWVRPVQRLYFYEFHHPKTFFINTILPNIKHSLSLALQHFYPLAGNLTWPQESTKPQLVYKPGDAVSLTVAESSYDFHHLSGHHTRDANMFTPLLPTFQPPAGDQKIVPLLALQVTIFPNEGICIGITISHVVCDGRTSTSFMKTWASVCKGGNGNDITPPFFNRSGLKFLEPRELKFLSSFKNVSREMALHSLRMDHVRPLDKVRATFVMIASDIRKLKHYVLARLENEDDQALTDCHVSSFVVTCAYVWVCSVKARWEGTDSGEEMEHMIFPIDVRGRLNPPLPGTYFGNCIRVIDVEIKRSDLTGEDGIAMATKYIGKEIRSFDIYQNVDVDFLYLRDLPLDQIEGVSGSPKFAVYETDFGWGKPKKVELSSIDTGQVTSFAECPYEEGGIEIGLVKKKSEMDVFANLFKNYVEELS